MAQYPVFNHTVPKPDYGNPDAVADAMTDTIPDIVDRRLYLLRVIEDPPENNPLAIERPSYVGNDGVDYVQYYKNADPRHRFVTEALYESTELALNQEIERIDDAQRVQMDRDAASRLLDHQSRTPRGIPEVPLFLIENAGDQTNTPFMNQHYADLVERNGTGDLFRRALIDRGGHCNFTTDELVTGINVVENRITSGEWDSTEPSALNDRSGSNAFAEPKFPTFNGEWRLGAYSDKFNM
jgi:hypothetical protein